MLTELDNFYANQEEPSRGCFLALRDIIIAFDDHVHAAWKYQSPFFEYKGRAFCYLWKDKKSGRPYIGFIEGGRIDHPRLDQGNRKRMKVFEVDPNKDLPIKDIKAVLKVALGFYKSGLIKTKY